MTKINEIPTVISNKVKYFYEILKKLLTFLIAKLFLIIHQLILSIF